METAPDTLAIGGGGPARRTIVILLTVAALVAVAAFAVDSRARASETQAIEACATDAVAAAREAWSPVLAMSGYVRPVLDASGSRSLRRAMYALVSRAADGAATPLVRAMDVCRRVAVLPHHGALRQRRDDCVRALDDQRRFLDQVARNGATISEEWPHTLTRC